MKRKDIEVMAPAGSFESLMAAIGGGADSVYFGAEHLNMRAASSNNFTTDDLNKIVKICSENGLKSYLTVNVVVYDNEMEQMKEIINAAAKSGITAIIASDQSVINYAFSKGVEVHLSTQLNITNTETVRFYSSWADVAVLARELNLSQVKNIADEIARQEIRGPKGDLIKLEMFVHLSLHEYGKSANRGECYQLCRRSYIVTDRETGFELGIDNEFIMSPKDLCTIGFIDKIIESGVRVLKIEGRARSAEYVRTVASCYNEAVNAVAEGNYTPERVDEWTKRLATVFNRGFWDGYYLGQKIGEWTNRYGSSATKRKVYLGKVTNYFVKAQVAEILLESGDLKKGETIIITGPTTGAIEYLVDEIRVDLKVTCKALKGEYCSIKSETFLRRSDKVFRWADAERDKN
jgi:putative protease